VSLERRRLRVEFSTEPAFRSEYLSNISNGGVFIATHDRFAVRDPVVVELDLSWCGEVIELDGEIVHRIGAEMAETGAVPGVAIQFELPAKELRGRFEPVVGPIEGNERVTKSGRRAAPRTPARITVCLQTADGREVPCRTRDVSSTGLLISLDDQAVLPIGEEVGLVIDHPSRSETMSVNGAVVRHLKADDGRVTALGIEFRTSAARKTEVSGFMNDIRAAEHSRRLGGITGPIAELGIENLLQMFGASSPSGMLTVTRGAEEGTIVFESGQLRAARLGSHTGREALREMLGWREGGFEFQAHVDSRDWQGEGEGVSLNGAILDAMCAIDESARSAAQSGRSSTPTGTAPRATAAPSSDADLDLDLDLDLGLGLGAETREAPRDPQAGQAGAKALRARVGGARKLDPSLLPPRKKDRAEAAPVVSPPPVSSAKAVPARKPTPTPTPTPQPSARTKPAAASPSTNSRIGQKTRFQVDAARADEQRSELDKIEQAVLDLALVGMGVARMVEVIPEPELEVYRALDGLIERGILRGE
jgi:Tfp pilus assembly protein PilZ